MRILLVCLTEVQGKSRLIYLVLFFISFTQSGNAQSYFRSCYRFKSAKFETFIGKENGFEKSLATNQRKLLGNIIGQNSDTLLIRFWDIINTEKYPDRFKGSTNFINSADNEKDFYYVLTDYKVSVPFRFRMLTATNIPFKVALNDKKLTTDFLNFGISYFWVWGKTNFYKNDFVPTRDWYVGLGPYVGLSSIDDPNSEDDQFGLSFGANAIFSIYDLNFLIALGADQGFKANTNELMPYVGFGIGFKMVEITTPKDQTVKYKE